MSASLENSAVATGLEKVSLILVPKKSSAKECSDYSISSIQFSCSVVSDSLRPRESQHARPPCPSSAPGVYSNSCPSSRWCHPAISSSAIPFSSCPQSLPASGSFPMSHSLHEVAKDYSIVALISHASKVMLKLLQARLQQYVNWALPDVQAGFRKGRGTRV